MNTINSIINNLSLNITEKMIPYQQDFEGMTLEGIRTMPYAPDVPCFDWCVVQHTIHSNNLELGSIILVVLAYICIVLYGIADEIKIIKPFKDTFIYWAKLLLILFFGYYILVIRMGLVDLVNFAG